MRNKQLEILSIDTFNPESVFKLNEVLTFLLLNNASIKSQIKKEKIYFESANPFSLSHIIKGLNKLEKQEVFGQLTIPLDSILSFNYWCCWFSFGIHKYVSKKWFCNF